MAARSHGVGEGSLPAFPLPFQMNQGEGEGGKMGIYQRGNILWYKFKKEGRPYYKSSESTDPAEAERLLRIAQGDVARGKTPIVIFNQVTLDELAQDFLSDFKIQKQKSLDHAERYVRELKEFFGNAKVTGITTTKIREYIQKRQGADLANASINRELSALKRMFSLAAEADPPKIDRVPKIPMLEENNVRKGFFEYNEYEALYEALPDYLKPVLSFGYFSGWRVMEILSLKWNQVDLEQGKACLLSGETKNKESREIYLDSALLGKLKVLSAKRNLLCPFVFQRDGERIKRFTRAWETALRSCGFVPVLKCRSCGGTMDFPKKRKKGLQCPSCGSTKLRREGRIFHDLRRTAAREDVRAGIPEGVAMKKGGWKTRLVFERYNITDEKDLKQAAEMRRFRVQALQEGGRGDNPGFIPSKTHQENIDNDLNSLEKCPRSSGG